MKVAGKDPASQVWLQKYAPKEAISGCFHAGRDRAKLHDRVAVRWDVPPIAPTGPCALEILGDSENIVGWLNGSRTLKYLHLREVLQIVNPLFMAWKQGIVVFRTRIKLRTFF